MSKAVAAAAAKRSAAAKHAAKQPRRSRGLTKIRKTEVSRAIQGVVDAGLTPSGIEVDPISGKFRVLVGGPAGEGNALDDWQRKKDARPA